VLPSHITVLHHITSRSEYAKPFGTSAFLGDKTCLNPTQISRHQEREEPFVGEDSHQ
jgi:hypothetical protein